MLPEPPRVEEGLAGRLPGLVRVPPRGEVLVEGPEVGDEPGAWRRGAVEGAALVLAGQAEGEVEPGGLGDAEPAHDGVGGVAEEGFRPGGRAGAGGGGGRGGAENLDAGGGGGGGGGVPAGLLDVGVGGPVLVGGQRDGVPLLRRAGGGQVFDEGLLGPEGQGGKAGNGGQAGFHGGRVPGGALEWVEREGRGDGGLLFHGDDTALSRLRDRFKSG